MHMHVHIHEDICTCAVYVVSHVCVHVHCMLVRILRP